MSNDSRYTDAYLKNKILYTGTEGNTLLTRGTPHPTETQSAFSRHDAFQNAIPNDGVAALFPKDPVTLINSPPSLTRDAKLGGIFNKLLHHYTVTSVNPKSQGLFNTDQIDPRPPESSSWKGNHTQIPTPGTNTQLLRHAFGSNDLPMPETIESDIKMGHFVAFEQIFKKYGLLK